MSIALWAWPIIGPIGAVGALLRYRVDAAVNPRTTDRFPLGTLIVNLSGALLLGIVHGAGLDGNALLLVGTAGLGTYTTFSTLIFETERLLEEGDQMLAAANLLGSMILGLDAVVLGWGIGRGL
jgi:CrcB protein